MSEKINTIKTEYELINPSDPYTFIAEDFETAALVVFSLSTMYGAKSKDGNKNVPVFVLDGAEKWYYEHFGRSVEEGLKVKMMALAEALSSMMLGTFEDRRRYNVALEAITDTAKKEKFIKEWQDGHGSLNDIGSYAHKLAKKLSCQYS